MATDTKRTSRWEKLRKERDEQAKDIMVDLQNFHKLAYLAPVTGIVERLDRWRFLCHVELAGDRTPAWTTPILKPK